MTSPVRVRFAPSPTGFFHVGSARTALFNWLFARRSGGTFVLRIEDTDAERNREEWVDGITSAMTWIGATWDEGPYRQSERGARHAEAATKLLADGRAYYCDCAREAVDARTPKGAAPGYDGFCRERQLGPGPGTAVRFRVPDEGSTTVIDLIRGTPTFDNATIEDFIVVRSSGAPMFLLANVVDDLDMAITHVIRGEEHLPNTPKALLLWEALGGGPPPVFAHVPVLVNAKRQKLSKRRDPVALEGYRDDGYLPEAIRNYLMLLGWGPAGEREIVTLDEMIEEFRLEDVNSSPAFFDVVKLTHINGVYIRSLAVEEFIERSQPWLVGPAAPWPADGYDARAFARLAPLVQERVEKLSEVPAMVDFLFLDEPVIDEGAWAKATKGPGAQILDSAIETFAVAPWEAASLHQALEVVGEPLGLKLNKTQAPVRVALTGRGVGPPLFESLEVLGRERTLDRLRAARARLA